MKIKVLFFILGIILIFILGPVSFLGKLSEKVVLIFNNHENIVLSYRNLKPKIFEPRVWEINLSKNKIYFFENGKLKKIIPLAYQAPEGVWYQTPTGYFRVGVKKEKHISSIFPVYMNYAVQMYEDFFIHEIPYYLNGERVSSDFTGGCIRLGSRQAREFFRLAKKGDLIISYKDLDNFQVKEDFIFPVNKNDFYIRQRFNNPLRVSWNYSKDRELDYYQHAGVDLAPYPDAQDLNVYNIYHGKVVKIVFNGKDDHGMGNTVIIEHQKDGLTFYSLYAHLENISNIKEGEFVEKGKILGKVGATGYGCSFWKVGKDGCNEKAKLDIHLHFEIKKKPVLDSPKEVKCFFSNFYTKCYGYVPDNPQNYGYYDPLRFLGRDI